MQDWTECPEAAGPVSENAAGGLDIQALAQHSVRLPQLDQAALADGVYVPRRGHDPYRMPPEMVERERDQAARTFERRQVAERAAFAAGMSALEAASTASRLLAEAAEIADKAVSA